MQPSRWATILQARAQHIRNAQAVAAKSSTEAVATGLEELASLYRDTARRAEAVAAAGVAPAAKRTLVASLELRARTFLNHASMIKDAKGAAELRSLSAIFGHEAEHLMREAA